MPASRLTIRFDELLKQIAAVEVTRSDVEDEWGMRFSTVDSAVAVGWKLKVRNLLALACGRDSEHFRDFVETEKPQSYRDSWEELQQLKHILWAAQEDYNGGYLDTVRSLVQAELFSNELDQAKELLAASYATPAAVVAGTVLETKLREMCASAGLPTGKLDKMNADLAKSGAYTVLVQKRITALADVRNSAAHGHPHKFTAEDVADMIVYIERFVTDHA